MGKKKTEHVVFDNMRKIRNRVDIKEYNSRTHNHATSQSKKSITASRREMDKHMNYFVEGLQDSGKSTLIRKLSELHPEHTAL